MTEPATPPGPPWPYLAGLGPPGDFVGLLQGIKAGDRRGLPPKWSTGSPGHNRVNRYMWDKPIRRRRLMGHSSVLKMICTVLCVVFVPMAWCGGYSYGDDRST